MEEKRLLFFSSEREQELPASSSLNILAENVEDGNRCYSKFAYILLPKTNAVLAKLLSSSERNRIFETLTRKITD